MPLKTWKKISEAVLFKNSWWTYKKDEIELPSRKRGEYHYVHTNGASMVVPVLSDGRIVFVNQYRYLNDRESLELPCGGVKVGTYTKKPRSMNLKRKQDLLHTNGTRSANLILTMA
jgi:ADP-ribose pyrophosphatase